MRKTGTNLSEYIESYDQAWARLMEKQHLSTPREDGDRSILTTWTLSFNSLQLQSENAANLLMLWAFLDDRDLWYELSGMSSLRLHWILQLPTKCLIGSLGVQVTNLNSRSV